MPGRPVRLAIATHAPGTGAGAPEGDVLLRRALEARGCAVEQVAWSDASAAWPGLDGVVVRSTWDYHLRGAEFLAWLDRLDVAGVPCVNPSALLRWNLDKRYLRGLAEAGVAVPDTVWLGPGERAGVAEVLRVRGWAAAVAKPLVSASAHRTELVTSGEVEGPAMLQALVPEIRSAGERSLVFLGGAFSHAVVKRPAAGDFRVQKELGGTWARQVPPAETVSFATRVLALAPVAPAFARVDLVETARGPVLMELEVLEPELFLGEEEADRLAEAVLAALRP
ncbi:MAG: hypothetical protein QM704_04300 [Anaeromyxobacteraceae bacterium]